MMSQPRAFVGIDVGLKGGLAFVSDGWAEAIPMPLILSKYFDTRMADEWLNDCLAISEARLAAIGVEHVRAFNQGVTSAFTFGGNYHACMSWSLFNCKHVINVEPIDWQAFGLGQGTQGNKDTSRLPALIKWPTVDWPKAKTKQEGLADALWIAHLIMNAPRPTVHEVAEVKKNSKRRKTKKANKQQGGTPKTLGTPEI